MTLLGHQLRPSADQPAYTHDASSTECFQLKDEDIFLSRRNFRQFFIASKRRFYAVGADTNDRLAV
jgi:hypothetical protein